MASWMVLGAVLSSGSRVRSLASMTDWSSARNAARVACSFIAGDGSGEAGENQRRVSTGTLRIFVVGLERLGLNFAVGLLEQNFNSALGFFELLLAFARELHALFEKFHGFIERKISGLEALDDFFEARKRFLEFAFARRLGRFVGSCSHFYLICRSEQAFYRTRQSGDNGLVDVACSAGA